MLEDGFSIMRFLWNSNIFSRSVHRVLQCQTHILPLPYKVVPEFPGSDHLVMIEVLTTSFIFLAPVNSIISDSHLSSFPKHSQFTKNCSRFSYMCHMPPRTYSLVFFSCIRKFCINKCKCINRLGIIKFAVKFHLAVLFNQTFIHVFVFQLTYDYKFEIEDDSSKIACLCGSANCRKWMN